MASSWFANGIQNIMNGTIDLNASTLRAALITATGSSALQFDTHADLGDIEGQTWEADSATHPIVSTQFAIVAAADHVNFGSGSQVISFTNVATGKNANGMIIYRSGATRAASELICYNSFTSAVSTDGGDVQVTLDGSGFARASY